MLISRKSLLLILQFSIVLIDNADCTKWLIDNPGFDSPDSWISNYLPCPSEEVIFPEMYSAALPLPADVAIGAFVLPREGALLLELDSTISLGTKTNAAHNCENRKAYIKPVNVRRWFNPNSWRSDDGVNGAIPDMERVPCSNEALIIPRKGALAIDVENVPILQLGQLSLAGSLISRDYLEYLFKTDLGQVLFKNAEVTSVEYYRDDICGCHKDVSTLTEPICHNILSTCPVPHCLVPFVPLESCCAICGSSLQLTVDYCDYAKLKKLRKIIGDAIADQDLKNDLDFHVNYVSSAQGGKILQAVIVDRHAYSETSVNFLQRLNSTTAWSKIFAEPKTQRLQMKFSGRPYNPNLTFGSILLIIMCLLFVFAVIGFIIFSQYHTNHRYLARIPPWINNPRRIWRELVLRSQFVFARFDNARSPVVEADMQESIIMGYDAENEEVHERAFDNPMFGGKIRKNEEDKSMELDKKPSGRGESGSAVNESYGVDDEQEMTEINLESDNDQDNDAGNDNESNKSNETIRKF